MCARLTFFACSDQTDPSALLYHEECSLGHYQPAPIGRAEKISIPHLGLHRLPLPLGSTKSGY
jgi:hypothetical protein